MSIEHSKLCTIESLDSLDKLIFSERSLLIRLKITSLFNDSLGDTFDSSKDVIFGKKNF